MIHLAIDTSGDFCLLLLFRGHTVVSQRFFPHQNNLSGSLLPSLSDLFRETGLRPKDLSTIFVGTGPGSYTGVRIGVSVASLFASGLNIPLYPFCSLIPFIPETLREGPFLFIFDSGHSNLFLLEGKITKEATVLVDREKVIQPENIAPTPEASLVSFDPEFVKKRISFSFDTISRAEPFRVNLPLFLPYLEELGRHPPSPPVISYLHTF